MSKWVLYKLVSECPAREYLLHRAPWPSLYLDLLDCVQSIQRHVNEMNERLECEDVILYKTRFMHPEILLANTTKVHRTGWKLQWKRVRVLFNWMFGVREREYFWTS